MIFVKQYGAKRTGTCYTTALLRKNYPEVHVLIHALGGKHQPAVPFDLVFPTRNNPPGIWEAIHAGNVRVLAVIKDPYAWAVSTVRAHTKWLKTFRAEYFRDPVEAMRPRVDQYLRQYRSYVSFPCRYKVIVPYERLLTDFDAETKRIARELELPDRTWENVTERVNPNDTLSRMPFYAAYYLEQRYWDDLDPIVKQYITESMDWDLLAQFGYIPHP